MLMCSVGAATSVVQCRKLLQPQVCVLLMPCHVGSFLFPTRSCSFPLCIGDDSRPCVHVTRCVCMCVSGSRVTADGIPQACPVTEVEVPFDNLPTSDYKTLTDLLECVCEDLRQRHGVLVEQMARRGVSLAVSDLPLNNKADFDARCVAVTSASRCRCRRLAALCAAVVDDERRVVLSGVVGRARVKRHNAVAELAKELGSSFELAVDVQLMAVAKACQLVTNIVRVAKHLVSFGNLLVHVSDDQRRVYVELAW